MGTMILRSLLRDWTMWDGFDPDNEEHRKLSDVAYIEAEGLKWRAV